MKKKNVKDKFTDNFGLHFCWAGMVCKLHTRQKIYCILSAIICIDRCVNRLMCWCFSQEDV